MRIHISFNQAGRGFPTVTEDFLDLEELPEIIREYMSNHGDPDLLFESINITIEPIPVHDASSV